HKCTICRHAINPGERYDFHSWMFDGRFYEDKVCRRCCYDIVRIVEHELAEGCQWYESWPPYDEVLNYLNEHDMGQTRPEDVPATFNVGDLPKMPERAGVAS